MKQTLLFALIMLLGYQYYKAQPMKLDDMRKAYLKGVESKDAAVSFYKRMEKNPDEDALTLAYKGASASLMARYISGPLNKLDYLAGTDLIFKKAVKKAPDNIEIRFLRFSYQHYVPKFLGYSKNLEEDRDVIVNGMVGHEDRVKADPLFHKPIVSFLLESKRLTPTQTEQVLALQKITGK